MFTGTIEPIDLDIAAIINEELSPSARSAALADFAREMLVDGEKQNSDAFGFVPAHTTKVDGAEGVDESRVKPDGEIEYKFDLLPDIFAWIYDMLEQFAPILSGAFKRSIALYADGVAIDPAGEIPQASEFVFESTVEYASKIEGEKAPPESPQAPNGVFEAVATLAAQRFGNQANIGFSYRAPIENPAAHLTPVITITLGS